MCLKSNRHTALLGAIAVIGTQLAEVEASTDSRTPAADAKTDLMNRIAQATNSTPPDAVVAIVEAGRAAEAANFATATSGERLILAALRYVAGEVGGADLQVAAFEFVDLLQVEEQAKQAEQVALAAAQAERAKLSGELPQ